MIPEKTLVAQAVLFRFELGLSHHGGRIALQVSRLGAFKTYRSLGPGPSLV